MEWDLTAHKAGVFQKWQRTLIKKGLTRWREGSRFGWWGARVRAEVKGKARAAGESGQERSEI